MSAIKELVRFQTDRGLDKKEYDALNEHANIYAELLESIGLDVPKDKRPELKEELNDFMMRLMAKDIAVQKYVQVPPSEQVDAYCDVITFAVGSILKLGYAVEPSLEQCALEINSRAGTMVDGKFEKDLSKEAQAKWVKADYTVALLPQ